MTRLVPILIAIADHRAAYDAFQVAPDDEAESVCCEMADSLDAMVLTACSFSVLTQPLPADVGDLLAHLRWWLAEEVVHADDYQPNYGILQGRAADLAMVLRLSNHEGYASGAYPSCPPDPIFVAIATADAAAVDHTEALADLDESDQAQMCRANAAADAASTAFVVVEETRPTTWAGLLALVEFYGRDLELYDRCSHGGGYFAHLAIAMRGCESKSRFWPFHRLITDTDQGVARAIPQAVFDASEQVAA